MVALGKLDHSPQAFKACLGKSGRYSQRRPPTRTSRSRSPSLSIWDVLQQAEGEGSCKVLDVPIRLDATVVAKSQSSLSVDSCQSWKATGCKDDLKNAKRAHDLINDSEQTHEESSNVASGYSDRQHAILQAHNIIASLRSRVHEPAETASNVNGTPYYDSRSPSQQYFDRNALRNSILSNRISRASAFNVRQTIEKRQQQLQRQERKALRKYIRRLRRLSETSDKEFNEFSSSLSGESVDSCSDSFESVPQSLDSFSNPSSYFSLNENRSRSFDSSSLSEDCSLKSCRLVSSVNTNFSCSKLKSDCLTSSEEVKSKKAKLDRAIPLPSPSVLYCDSISSQQSDSNCTHDSKAGLRDSSQSRALRSVSPNLLSWSPIPPPRRRSKARRSTGQLTVEKENKPEWLRQAKERRSLRIEKCSEDFSDRISSVNVPEPEWVGKARKKLETMNVYLSSTTDAVSISSQLTDASSAWSRGGLDALEDLREEVHKISEELSEEATAKVDQELGFLSGRKLNKMIELPNDRHRVSFDNAIMPPKMKESSPLILENGSKDQVRFGDLQQDVRNNATKPNRIHPPVRNPKHVPNHAENAQSHQKSCPLASSNRKLPQRIFLFGDCPQDIVTNVETNQTPKSSSKFESISGPDPTTMTADELNQNVEEYDFPVPSAGKDSSELLKLLEESLKREQHVPQFVSHEVNEPKPKGILKRRQAKSDVNRKGSDKKAEPSQEDASGKDRVCDVQLKTINQSPQSIKSSPNSANVRDCSNASIVSNKCASLNVASNSQSFTNAASCFFNVKLRPVKSIQSTSANKLDHKTSKHSSPRLNKSEMPTSQVKKAQHLASYGKARASLRTAKKIETHQRNSIESIECSDSGDEPVDDSFVAKNRVRIKAGLCSWSNNGRKGSDSEPMQDSPMHTNRNVETKPQYTFGTSGNLESSVNRRLPKSKLDGFNEDNNWRNAKQRRSLRDTMLPRTEGTQKSSSELPSYRNLHYSTPHKERPHNSDKVPRKSSEELLREWEDQQREKIERANYSSISKEVKTKPVSTKIRELVQFHSGLISMFSKDKRGDAPNGTIDAKEDILFTKVPSQQNTTKTLGSVSECVKPPAMERSYLNQHSDESFQQNKFSKRNHQIDRNKFSEKKYSTAKSTPETNQSKSSRQKFSHDQNQPRERGFDFASRGSLVRSSFPETKAKRQTITKTYFSFGKGSSSPKYTVSSSYPKTTSHQPITKKKHPILEPTTNPKTSRKPSPTREATSPSRLADRNLKPIPESIHRSSQKAWKPADKTSSLFKTTTADKENFSNPKLRYSHRAGDNRHRRSETPETTYDKYQSRTPSPQAIVDPDSNCRSSSPFAYRPRIRTSSMVSTSSFRSTPDRDRPVSLSSILGKDTCSPYSSTNRLSISEELNEQTKLCKKLSTERKTEIDHDDCLQTTRTPLIDLPSTNIRTRPAWQERKNRDASASKLNEPLDKRAKRLKKSDVAAISKTKPSNKLARKDSSKTNRSISKKTDSGGESENYESVRFKTHHGWTTTSIRRKRLGSTSSDKKSIGRSDSSRSKEGRQFKSDASKGLEKWAAELRVPGQLVKKEGQKYSHSVEEEEKKGGKVCKATSRKVVRRGSRKMSKGGEIVCETKKLDSGNAPESVEAVNSNSLVPATSKPSDVSRKLKSSTDGERYMTTSVQYVGGVNTLTTEGVDNKTTKSVEIIGGKGWEGQRDVAGKYGERVVVERSAGSGVRPSTVVKKLASQSKITTTKTKRKAN